MKQPETGTRNDLVEHRFRIAKEEIDAILSVEGIAFKRHKDTLAYFNKQYIASKEITLQQIETAEQLFYLAKEYYNEKRQQNT